MQFLSKWIFILNIYTCLLDIEKILARIMRRLSQLKSCCSRIYRLYSFTTNFIEKREFFMNISLTFWIILKNLVMHSLSYLEWHAIPIEKKSEMANELVITTYLLSEIERWGTRESDESAAWCKTTVAGIRRWHGVFNISFDERLGYLSSAYATYCFLSMSEQSPY